MEPPGSSRAGAPRTLDSLTTPPELLELRPVADRLELFRDLARLSQAQAGKRQTDLLFPLVQQGELLGAPGFDTRTDLLQAADAGQLALLFGRGEAWAETPSESLGGLSEREAAELLARTVLVRWALHSAGPVQVERVAGVPYAVAYVNGVLRVNPAFLYLVTSVGPLGLAQSQ